MAKHVTLRAEYGDDIVEATLASDGYPTPSVPWLRWKDYGKGELDLSKLPKEVKKLELELW